MGNWKFYDNDEEMEVSESEKEPSFSLYDFKSWLSKQKREPKNPLRETHEDKPQDDLRDKFKETMRNRVEEKIEKKLNEKKRKRIN